MYDYIWCSRINTCNIGAIIACIQGKNPLAVDQLLRNCRNHFYSVVLQSTNYPESKNNDSCKHYLSRHRQIVGRSLPLLAISVTRTLGMSLPFGMGDVFDYGIVYYRFVPEGFLIPFTQVSA